VLHVAVRGSSAHCTVGSSLQGFNSETPHTLSTERTHSAVGECRPDAFALKHGTRYQVLCAVCCVMCCVLCAVCCVLRAVCCVLCSDLFALWVHISISSKRFTLNLAALHCTALNCTALNCTALNCTALHWRNRPKVRPTFEDICSFPD
jgi:hypothetical protein